MVESGAGWCLVSSGLVVGVRCLGLGTWDLDSGFVVSRLGGGGGGGKADKGLWVRFWSYLLRLFLLCALLALFWVLHRSTRLTATGPARALYVQLPPSLRVFRCCLRLHACLWMVALWVVGVGGGMADGIWRMADGGWRIANGGWRLAVGGWRLAVGGWRLADRGCGG
jgi:hypothetical protein